MPNFVKIRAFVTKSEFYVINQTDIKKLQLTYNLFYLTITRK